MFLAFTSMNFVAIAQKSWKVDPVKSEISFNKFDDDVVGSISGLKAEIKLDLENPAGGSIKASVDVKTLSTGISDRDDHLMEDDFFGQKGNPQIVFQSSKIIKTKSGFLAYGKLTIKGITLDVQMPFVYDADKTMFVGRIKIHTGNFGVMGDKSAEGEFNTVVRLNILAK